MAELTDLPAGRRTGSSRTFGNKMVIRGRWWNWQTRRLQEPMAARS